MNTRILLVLLASLLILSFVFSACRPKDPFPLREPGEYQFGTRMNIKFTDPKREDREIGLYIWYPATLPADAEPSKYNFDAEPDFSGAPYPVILSSAKVGMIFGPHLATHGFVVVGVDGQDSKSRWGAWLVDYPLDQVAALDQVASNPPEELDGMMDADQAGAMGYSFDGYNALALSGARIDPDFYQAQCESAAPGNPTPETWWIDYICNMEAGWDAFVVNAGTGITENDDGLWQSLTDGRIKAVMPMAPEGAWLFGERGLAEVDRPSLIIAATADDINYYDLEAVYIFEHLGISDKSMISFVDQDHMMIYNDDMRALMQHFAVAFFGLHLQGQEIYAEYISKEMISKQEGLAWGVYEQE